MSSIKCPECNLTNWATSISCKRCGYLFQEVTSQVTENIPTEDLMVTEENSVDTFSGPLPPEISPPTSLPPEISPEQVLPQQTLAAPTQPQPAYQTQYQQNYSSNYKSSSPKSSAPSKKLAIFSMVMGIFSFPMVNFIIAGILSVLLAFIFGVSGAIAGFVIALAILPLGLITGITALVKAKKHPKEYSGKGFAIAGISLSSLGILVIPIVVAIAIPNLLAARKAANEAAAISSIKTIASAEIQYLTTAGTGICPDLSQLGKNNLIDSVLASGSKSGYIFVITKLPQGCEIFATPANTKGVSATGIRSFYYSTEEGLIRAGNKNGLLADSNDKPLDIEGLPRRTTSPPQVASQK